VSVALLKKSTKLLDSKFLKLIMDGYIQSINVQQKVKGGVIKNLHLEDIRIVPLRLAPLREQKQIIIEVDRHFSIIKKLENQIENELKRSQSLRQSILKKAFEGKLLPQDPNDEPASVLLDRIKAEKSNPKKAKQMEMF
jgi:type I restriction enzyme S subunit